MRLLEAHKNRRSLLNNNLIRAFRAIGAANADAFLLGTVALANTFPSINFQEYKMKILQTISRFLAVALTAVLMASGTYAADSVETLQARRAAAQQAVNAANQTLQGKVSTLNNNPNYGILNSYYKRAMDLNVSVNQFDYGVIDERARWVEATYQKFRDFRGQANGANNFHSWYQQNYSAIETNYIKTLAHARHRAAAIQLFEPAHGESYTRTVNALFTRISAAEAKIEREMPTVLPWLDYVVANENETFATPGYRTTLVYGQGHHDWKVKDVTPMNTNYTCNNNIMNDPSKGRFKVCMLIPYNILTEPGHKCAEAGQRCDLGNDYMYFVAELGRKEYWADKNKDFNCPSNGACYAMPIAGPWAHIYDNFNNSWPRIKQ